MHPRAQQIMDLTGGWRTGADAEAQAITVLQEVPADQLDAVLVDLDIDALIGEVDDRRWGPDHRTALLDVLLRQRIDALSTGSIVGIIAALHSGPTPRSHQQVVVDVLTSRTGSAFHDLKYHLNSARDHHDLEHLVFDELEQDLRDRLLAHIAEQASVEPTSDLRVLCDIDDTLRCALHDDRYPRGTLYPGVVALLRALDDGASGAYDRPGDLTFVTARPGGPRGLVEKYTRNGLAELGLPPHSVLGGSMLNVHTKAAIAERKVANMQRDRLLFPECRMVFIGDSGQADGEVGAQMHRLDPEHIVGTLLHNVTGLADEARAEYAEQGVFVFDTYSGAAAHALRLGLLRPAQANEVASAVREGLVSVALSADQRERLERNLAVEEEALAAAVATTGEQIWSL